MFGTLLAALLLAGVAGCQTTKGFGRDVENTGDAIEGAAEAND
ncbi:MAG: entericidin A/B family lipoprotein [Planctomycetota bacterium]|nr:entericidin A/B family lipoprotein [Planctomycetota bacterium]